MACRIILELKESLLKIRDKYISIWNFYRRMKISTRSITNTILIFTRVVYIYNYSQYISRFRFVLSSFKNDFIRILISKWIFNFFKIISIKEIVEDIKIFDKKFTNLSVILLLFRNTLLKVKI